MKRSEYVFEFNAIIQRIINTSDMVNSYRKKFYENWIYPSQSDALADIAKHYASNFNVEREVDPSYWGGLADNASISALDEKLQSFQDTLKMIQGESVKYQYIHAELVTQGALD